MSWSTAAADSVPPIVTDLGYAEMESISVPPVTVHVESTKTFAAWETQRERILDLYSRQNLPLQEIMILMEKNHAFKASAKSFKDHIARWGANNRNLKEDVIKAIIRKKGARDTLGKRSKIIYQGREIELRVIQRRIKRRRYNSKDMAQILVSRAPTPSQLRVLTPSPGPVLKPKAYVKFDKLLYNTRNLFFSTVTAQDCESPRGTPSSAFISAPVEIQKQRSELYESIAHSYPIWVPRGKLMANNIFMMKRCLQLIRDGTVGYWSLHLFRISHYLGSFDSLITGQILGFAKTMTKSILGPNDPLTIYWHSLVIEDPYNSMRLVYNSLADIATGMLGAMHPITIYLRIVYEQRYRPETFESFCNALLNDCDQKAPLNNFQAILILDHLMFHYTEQREYSKVEQFAFEALERCRNMSQTSETKFCAGIIHERLALLYCETDNRYDALSHMWLAVHAFSSNHKSRDNGELASLLGLIEHWQQAWGEHEASKHLAARARLLVTDAEYNITYEDATETK